MLRILVLSFIWLIAGSAFANQTTTVDAHPADVLQSIFSQSIEALNNAHNQPDGIKIEKVNSIIHSVILPNINVERSTQFALKKHWQDISDENKEVVQTYIINSLIEDYATFLLSYEDFNSLEMIIKDDIQIKDNRALINITLLENAKPIDVPITFKMIAEGKWQIYDLIVSGVSLMKSFQSSFNSTIRRKGLEYFISSLERP